MDVACDEESLWASGGFSLSSLCLPHSDWTPPLLWRTWAVGCILSSYLHRGQMGKTTSALLSYALACDVKSTASGALNKCWCVFVMGLAAKALSSSETPHRLFLWMYLLRQAGRDLPLWSMHTLHPRPLQYKALHVLIEQELQNRNLFNGFSCGIDVLLVPRQNSQGWWIQILPYFSQKDRIAWRCDLLSLSRHLTSLIG